MPINRKMLIKQRGAKALMNDQRLMWFVLIAALLMPAAVPLLSHYVGGSPFTESISAYYYGVSRDLFVMTLALAGLLLIAYEGREGAVPGLNKIGCEYWVSQLGGIASFAIAIFPMNRERALAELKITNTADQPPATWVERLFPAAHEHVHVASAMVFFVLAAFLCFLFSRKRAARPADDQDVLSYCAQQVWNGVRHDWSGNRGGVVFKLWGFWILAGIGWAAVNMLNDAEIYWPEVWMLVGFVGAWSTRLFVRVELKEDPEPVNKGNPAAAAAPAV